jgi:putative endonuclease
LWGNKMYFVYILLTDRGTLYTGQTNNLEKRMAVHKSGKGAKYLRSFKSFELVYTEEVSTLSQALKREAEIKKWPRQKKLELVK